jgi:hypothetical protein
MCNCGGGKTEFTGVFTPNNPDNIILVALNAHSTASRVYTVPSGRKYRGGGGYHTVMAFPDDVAYLTNLKINNQFQFTQE